MIKRLLKFSLFYILSLIVVILIYYLTFQANFINPDYVHCTLVNNFEIIFNSNSITFPYTSSCDQNDYFLIFEKLENIYLVKDFKYQNRPVYLLFTYLIYKPFSFLQLDKLLIYKIATLNVQISTIFLLSIFFNKVFDLKNNFKNFFSTFILLSLSPLIKWTIFDIGNHIITVFIFPIALVIYKNKLIIRSKVFQFSLGLLYLTHRSSVTLIIYTLIISFLFQKELNIRFRNFISMVTFSTFPIVLHELLKTYNNSGGDQNVDLYNQFFWIVDYLKKLPTKTTGWYCQSIPEFLTCYFNDSISTLTYLAPVTFFILSCFIFLLLKKQFYSEIKPLMFIFILQFTFWSFIGWYPPIRFSYYAVGNMIIVLTLLFYHKLLDEKFKLIFLFSYFFIFIRFEHWNVENFILLKLDNFILLLIFISYLIFSNFKKIQLSLSEK